MLIPCMACDSRFLPDEYFRACHNYQRGTDSVAWTCPHCGNQDDLRILPGELGFGATGRGRFDVHDRVRVPGLRRRRQDLRLDISLDQKVWRVPTATRRPGEARCFF
ncbi:hypothetical protein C1I98_10570 [Spongiactinospora gelatinilytica]|uniref:Uncharacterized protein n=1 Tax=Spongiactinospora gelatinilytica TaxID=2666298 RepID=A0A2W2HWM2_9ACTN|nr:hypothetical protein [Spongiactinospora gelatinilytica]PZG50377.1 hypothetical protein C1I98_10570 [Spongiactinospora gelatinilytica]